MSEKIKIYSSSVAVTVEAFKNRSCSLPACHPNYVSPTPQDIKSLRHLIGFSQTDLGVLGNKSVSVKGCTAVRKWESATDSTEYRPMDYCLWRQMLYIAGISSINDDIEALRKYKNLNL
ncbi:hypothetical protein [Shewanella frigidimarina]|uniref:hypothetical protein n=1 Tax=Shewanella frigidimarina TaxID=56812 RepID=UPI003D7AA006